MYLPLCAVLGMSPVLHKEWLKLYGNWNCWTFVLSRIFFRSYMYWVGFCTEFICIESSFVQSLFVLSRVLYRVYLYWVGCFFLQKLLVLSRVCTEVTWIESSLYRSYLYWVVFVRSYLYWFEFVQKLFELSRVFKKLFVLSRICKKLCVLNRICTEVNCVESSL
jgi:hypothetical protein